LRELAPLCVVRAHATQRGLIAHVGMNALDTASVASPMESGARAPATLVALAKVGRPYGLTGAMHVYPFSNDASTLKRAKSVVIGSREYAVKTIRDHGDSLVMMVSGVDSPEIAQTLTNAEIHVDRSAFPPLAEGEYYWIDLVGLTCTNGERVFGSIVEVFEAGAHPILRVRQIGATDSPVQVTAAPPPQPGKEKKPDPRVNDELIPFVDAIVRSVSLLERRVDVDWTGID
jgi:16S rRNA processing protein RimM